ncbi:MAG: hypothetical protein ACR2P6_04965 [Gammaproteobacteria bacterium]
MARNLSLAFILAVCIGLPATVFAGAHGSQKVSKIDELPVRSGDWSDEEISRGRDQLVQVFDAAWIRVIARGEDLDILATEPKNKPGEALNYIWKLFDCLPDIETAPFPEKPVGMFKDILETGKIRQLVQGVPETQANTSWYFSGVSEKYKQAIFAEINKHYDVELEIENVVLPPGRLPATGILTDGKVDFISQLNATGGITQGMRRRESRRFTCTLSASSQYIHIPEKSKLVDEIKSLSDLMARPDVSICAGPLSTQTAQAFMPEHTVKTRFVDDLKVCDRDVEAGKYSVIMNPLHDLGVADIDGYVAVPTMMATGTPFWVAADGISCPSDGDPKTEDECHKVD